MKALTKTFLAGLAVGIPIIITVWVIVQAGTWLNGLAVGAAGRVWPAAGEAMARLPGVGIAAMLALILLIGLAARFWLTARLLHLLEYVLEHLPLVKTVYTSIRDMLRFFGGSGGGGRVVLYRPPGGQIRMLAILTNERPIGLPAAQAEGMVAIWLPMSYQIGGYMLYVPVETVEPVDLSVEQVMKLTATAELGASRLVEAAAKV